LTLGVEGSGFFEDVAGAVWCRGREEREEGERKEGGRKKR